MYIYIYSLSLSLYIYIYKLIFKNNTPYTSNKRPLMMTDEESENAWDIFGKIIY